MAEGYVRPQRQQVGVGPADRLRPPKGPGELAIAPLGPLGSPYPSKRGPVVQFLDGYVPGKPAFGGQWETRQFQLNHEISSLQLPRARGG